ncbi:MAG: xylose isomerase, partial [Candidatus Limnocylindrales bacterium]
MGEAFFTGVTEPIRYGGPDSTDPLEYKVWQPDRLVLGKPMVEWLRPGVCVWHSFSWDGRDMFGVGTLDRPWLEDADEMAGARTRLAAAFEFFAKLGAPYYCFHDRDVAPEGSSFAEFRANLDA